MGQVINAMSIKVDKYDAQEQAPDPPVSIDRAAQMSMYRLMSSVREAQACDGFNNPKEWKALQRYSSRNDQDSWHYKCDHICAQPHENLARAG